ncbi:uncharacterized protein J4E78_001689 [Alternaria triticimaculans]|uniref:uncharacterized protein n=1 Tax=Alternaria triticimaculans TaxID=297637 RepID=UPI0020C3F41E|nr:uncharacterized protein J4E78_001689 [Alternaria triticimaculans]KAI4667870.1 hypothetical protein J4E78_001689 [Alternaria triticimaculans]
MPLLALTKGQKKAAKRAAKRQGASATKEVAPSNVEYTLVDTIEPERFDAPAIPLIPTQDSATSTRDDGVSTPQPSSFMSSEDIDAASSTSTALQQLPPSSTDVTGCQSSGPSPTLSALPLESLGSFNDSFTFEARTGVATFGERSNITDVFNNEYGSSFPQDVEDIEDESPTLLAFSEAFVKELGSPTFTTAAASSKAFEEALSRKPDATGASIFTRLEDATIDDAPASVCTSKFPFTAADIQKKTKAPSEDTHQERALVPYYTPKQIGRAIYHEVDQGLDETSTNLSLGNIFPCRIFLASTGGVIQCIAYDQLLHDVDTIKDDGGSDFDSVASPSKGYLEPFSRAHDKTSESIDSRIEDAQSDLGIPERLHDVNNAGLEGSEVSDLCDREELSSHTEGSNFGSDDAASVSTEKCEVVATQQGSPQSTTRSGSKEELCDTALNDLSNGELAEKVVTSPQVQAASNGGPDVSIIRLGTELLSSYLEVMEAEESGKVTRDAVVTAFLKLVNIERKKRGFHALPSLYTAHSVLSSSILQHTVKLGTTTVASFVAQLSFDEKDEVEMGDVCAAWDRLGREEVGQQPMASEGIMATLGRALGRLGGSYLEK